MKKYLTLSATITSMIHYEGCNDRVGTAKCKTLWSGKNSFLVSNEALDDRKDYLEDKYGDLCE